MQSDWSTQPDRICTIAYVTKNFNFFLVVETEPWLYSLIKITAVLLIDVKKSAFHDEVVLDIADMKIESCGKKTTNVEQIVLVVDSLLILV